LFLLSMKEQVRQLKGKLPDLQSSLMLAGGLFDKKQLEDQILLQSARRVFELDEALPRSRDQFESLLKNEGGRFAKVAAEVSALVLKCHQRYHQIQKRLKGRIDLAAVTILNDIKQQLAGLIHSEYVAKTPWQMLKEYERYMNAVELRLEKYQRDLNQQRFYSDQLSGFWQQYEQRLQQHEKQGFVDDELTAFRWMLEEYRVSLFAQQLGTLMTVSEKRLRQQWQRVQG